VRVSHPNAESRSRLSRDRVVAAAIALADANGIQALTMRKLGVELGVDAMSLYHHVANKSDLLDGMIDGVFTRLISLRMPRTGERPCASGRLRLAKPCCGTGGRSG
jgi:AcrR family transcriptional regulator